MVTITESAGDLATCIKWSCILLGVGVGLRAMQNSFVYSPSRQYSMISTECSKKYNLTHTR